MGRSAFKGGLLVLVLVPLCAASLCQFGKEYWSEEEGACVKCSRCEQPGEQVVLRPCQVHRDTVCGPLSSLPIDWPWIKKRSHDAKTVTEQEHQHHHHRPRSHAHEHVHQHQHEKQRNQNEFNDPPPKKQHRPLPPLPPLPRHHHQLQHNGDDWPIDSLADVDEWEHWLQKQLQHKKEDLLKSLLLEEKRNKLAHTFDDDDDDDTPSNEEDESTTHLQHVSRLDLEIFEKLVNEERQSRLDEPSTVSEMVVTRRRLGSDSLEPFSAAETLVWDWQAIALISAVIACLLFFVLATIYSLLHVRQWRRLKDDLHLDVEDLAVRVSLMNSGGLNSPNTDGGNTNHYLEQLLAVKKGENMSNVYVEKQPIAS